MHKPQKEEITSLKALPASPDDIGWLNFRQKEKQETLKRLEDTAKYLSGLASVSLAILLGPNKEIFGHLNNPSLMKAGIFCWLISILLTLAVIFPFRYGYVANSAESIKRMYKKIAGLKLTFLLIGAILYLAGITILAWLYLSSGTGIPK